MRRRTLVWSHGLRRFQKSGGWHWRTQVTWVIGRIERGIWRYAEDFSQANLSEQAAVTILSPKLSTTSHIFVKCWLLTCVKRYCSLKPLISPLSFPIPYNLPMLNSQQGCRQPCFSNIGRDRPAVMRWEQKPQQITSNDWTVWCIHRHTVSQIRITTSKRCTSGHKYEIVTSRTPFFSSLYVISICAG